MKPRDRFLEAVYLGEPDTVPVFELWLADTIVEQIIGEKPRSTADTVTRLRCHQKLGLDAFVAWEAGSLPTPVGEEIYIDEWGRKWKSSAVSDIGFYVGPTMKGPDDVKNFEPPNPNAPERLEPFEKAVRMARGEKAIVAGIHDVFELPCLMYGQERFLLSLITDPSTAKRLIEMSFKFNVEVAKAVVDLGIDAVLSGDDYAYKSGPFMSPKTFERYFYPYIKELAFTVRKRGVPFIKHCDGDHRLLMSYWVQCANAVCSFEGPDTPLGNVNYLAEMKEKYGDCVCLMGNINSSHTLLLGTKQDIIEETRRCIEVAAPGGGYALCSDNAVMRSVPIENCLAIPEASRKYGKYPLIK